VTYFLKVHCSAEISQAISAGFLLRIVTCILYTQIDPEIILGTRWKLDAAGHYARPDVFQLTVRKSPTPILAVQNDYEELGRTVNDIKEDIVPEEI